MPPVSVITAARPAGGEPLGREYPWGLAESESRRSGYSHSEVEQLRRFLLIDGLLDLKTKSDEHYETYRGRALRARAFGLQALLRGLLSPQIIAALLLLPRNRRLLKSVKWADLKSLPGVVKRLKPPTSLLRSKKADVPPPPLPAPPPRRRHSPAKRLVDFVWGS